MSANEAMERQYLKYLKDKYEVAKPASEPKVAAEPAAAAPVVEQKKRGRKTKEAAPAVSV